MDRCTRKGKMPGWLVVVLAALGLILLIPALWVFVSLTARPLHPNPAAVPTVRRAAPSPEFAGAVEKARQIALGHLTGENLPGLSVAVGLNGEIVWAEGFGYADLKTSTPVTPEHRFRIGTASTALSSAAAGLLLEEGRLKLDDEIQTYVPAFPKKQWPVTLHNLMGHTAGIVPEDHAGQQLFTKHCRQTSDALQYVAGEPLLFQPGTQRRDSTYGWILVSAAAEAAAGQPFFTFLRERVFDPLGMRATVPDPSSVPADDDFPIANMFRELIHDPGTTRDATPDPTRKPADDRVTPYFTRFGSDPNYGLHLMRPLDYSCYAGAAAFVSTPSDMVRFGMAIQAGKLLKPATVELLQTPQRLSSGQETGYGLGWDLQTVTLAGRPTRVKGHNGDSFGGMVASLLTIPDSGIVVAVTSNISHANTFSLAVKLAEPFVPLRQ